MKIGIVITMYDEHDLVLSSINEIRKNYIDSTIVVVHSDDEKETNSLKQIREKSKYIKLSDLSKTVKDKYTFPSKVILRNYNKGFSKLYDLSKEFDLVVAFTGDTLITDSTSFQRRYTNIKNNNWIAMVSVAVNQRFNKVGQHGELIREGRLQTNETTDFACCIFFLEGKFCTEKKAFSNIKMTNPYTSEQCLGDEILSHIEESAGSEASRVTNFHNLVGRLNPGPYSIHAYSYNDGVIYHASSGGTPAHRESISETVRIIHEEENSGLRNNRHVTYIYEYK